MSGTDSRGKEGDKEVIKEAIAFIKERNEKRKKLRDILIVDTFNAKGKILQILYLLLVIPAAFFWGVARIAAFIGRILDDIASWIVYLIFYCFMRNKEGENTDDKNTESN